MSFERGYCRRQQTTPEEEASRLKNNQYAFSCNDFLLSLHTVSLVEPLRPLYFSGNTRGVFLYVSNIPLSNHMVNFLNVYGLFPLMNYVFRLSPQGMEVQMPARGV